MDYCDLSALFCKTLRPKKKKDYKDLLQMRGIFTGDLGNIKVNLFLTYYLRRNVFVAIMSLSKFSDFVCF